ncbi:hypothetical protein K2173_023394 [Erythroxylum novogranatense]|uniref:DNA mismatch repair protein MLH3 n=1 Tax=Erythroxylum novogranatense TaxID=1862640 RepID=A0AAV8TYF8_9ROSI|nr:hypothetical protein K2173_023394 [Erythroxylum novogranatense]
MGDIRPLPEASRSSIRSGVIVFDLVRVVEELVLNSLDAGATKVSVYVGLRTCYVKVVDDGSGISRDGLELLGERYVTSKFHHLADTDTVNWSFGFRGEALASISDISLLEIVTKASGRPNGYRKTIKGSKCLYLGIDDEKKDFGTTIIVYDLFYNQPVRRKILQSSPKKVLHLVKQCVFQIALVHPHISFKVVDFDSEEELLSTLPSSTLTLLKRGFGIESSSPSHELNVRHGVLKLSGYIWGPLDGSADKAFQYIYINSRFVCKGPIHKLLNELAARFEHLDKCRSLSQKGKRSRPHAFPSYIVNLCCPSSLYDLIFEPSKTYVEFKDWVPILNFIEKAIQNHWKNSITQETAENLEFAARKCSIQNDLSSSLLASASSTMGFEQKLNGGYGGVSYNEFQHDLSGPKGQQSEMGWACQSDLSLPSLNGPPCDTMPRLTKRSNRNLLISDNKTLDEDGYFLEDMFTTRERFCDTTEGPLLRSEWEEGSPNIESGAKSVSYSYSLGHIDINDGEATRNDKTSFLESCSSQGSFPLNRDLIRSKEGFKSLVDSFNTKRRRFFTDEDEYLVEIDSCNTSFVELRRILKQDTASCAQWYPTNFMDIDITSDFIPSCSSDKSLSLHEKPYAKHLVPIEGLFEETAWGIEDNPLGKSFKGSSRSGIRQEYWNFFDSEENEHESSYDILSESPNKENDLSWRDDVFGSKYNAHNQKGCESHQRPILDELSLEHSHLSLDLSKAEYSLLEPYSKVQKSNEKQGSKRNQSRDHCSVQDHAHTDQRKRSHSAPPFYCKKRRLISLNQYSIMEFGKELTQLFHDGSTSPDDVSEIGCHVMTHRYNPTCIAACATDAKELKLHLQPYHEDPEFNSRPCTNNFTGIVADMENIQNNKKFQQLRFTQDSDCPGEGITKETITAGSKWRNNFQQIADNNASRNMGSQHDILDISSGFLHLAGNSLVPGSIHRNYLDDAKVLQQVDKKFIPIVAGKALSLIDQHAADERIRLEELRQKVLSGQEKTITYLDAEEELVLPEMGFQLLHNYAEQVRGWGWICNTEAQSAATFTKNLNLLHQQPIAVTLIAVPRILGVNLSDRDLLEFLQQLADTDGSSSMPPAVLRVLNFKACRGAIMFGDALLPSECALIVEELRRTSLCFQCAHGRPTAIPLVDLEMLHGQIAKLGVLDNDSSKCCHELRRQELNLERAIKRLNAARS